MNARDGGPQDRGPDDHRSDPDYAEDEMFPEDFRRIMRRVFAPLNWLRRH